MRVGGGLLRRGYGDAVRNPGPVRLSSFTLGSAADGQAGVRRCPQPAAQQVPMPWVTIYYIPCHRNSQRAAP